MTDPLTRRDFLATTAAGVTAGMAAGAAGPSPAPPDRTTPRPRPNILWICTDLAPTLLAAAALKVPPRMQGRSLLGILAGTASPHRHREFVRSVYYKVLQGPSSYATMIRTRRHKLVRYHGQELGELFDLAVAVDTGSRRVGRF